MYLYIYTYEINIYKSTIHARISLSNKTLRCRLLNSRFANKIPMDYWTLQAARKYLPPIIGSEIQHREDYSRNGNLNVLMIIAVVITFN